MLYGLADLLSKDRGWGVEDDSFRCLERMKQLGQPSWFSLGDLDLATHLIAHRDAARRQDAERSDG